MAWRDVDETVAAQVIEIAREELLAKRAAAAAAAGQRLALESRKAVHAMRLETGEFLLRVVFMLLYAATTALFAVLALQAKGKGLPASAVTSVGVVGAINAALAGVSFQQARRHKSEGRPSETVRD